MQEVPSSTVLQGNKGSGYLPTLDGWRAVAIGFVVLHHLYNASSDNIFGDAGPIGVKIFFGISGFLICSRLMDEQELTGRISISGFYIRRFFRILPAAFVYLLTLAVLKQVSLIEVNYDELIASAFFIRNYFPGTWLTQHLWSLAVEEHFYLIFPFLFACLGKSSTQRTVLVAAIMIAIWREIEKRYMFLTALMPNVPMYNRTDMCLDGLLFGCWFALIFRRMHWIFTSQLARYSSFLFPVLLYVMVIKVLHVPAIVFSIVISYAIAVTVANPDLLLSRLLETSPMRWVGRYSYSLYLWQQLASISSWPINIIPTFCFAIVSYRYIERPFIRLGHYFAKPVTKGRIEQ
jgi:peptidoglycan/LPS O-acetylase OafA/YrhL